MRILNRQLNYNEHYLDLNAKNKFKYVTFNVDIDNAKKESYKILFNHRKSDYDWIEFYTVSGSMFVATYPYMGGYVVRVADAGDWQLRAKWLSQFQRCSWLSQLIKSYEPCLHHANMFGSEEASQIIRDVAKYNKLSVFK